MKLNETKDPLNVGLCYGRGDPSLAFGSALMIGFWTRSLWLLRFTFQSAQDWVSLFLGSSSIVQDLGFIFFRSLSM